MRLGSELLYVYGVEAYNGITPGLQLLSTAMIDYWLSFIVSQTPNGGSGVLRMSPMYMFVFIILLLINRSPLGTKSPQDMKRDKVSVLFDFNNEPKLR